MKNKYKVPAIQLPEIPDAEQTFTTRLLIDIIDKQQLMLNEQGEEIAILKEEIKRLKKHKGKPKIRPSKMDKDETAKDNPEKKRPGSEKRQKTVDLKIHEEKRIPVKNVSKGAERKGYKDYVVQDLIIKTYNMLYLLERWQLPNGAYCIAPLPTKINGYHFGLVLRSFIDYQYHKQHVTQPALLNQLRSFGIDISAGQLNRLLTEKKESFHQEKEEILSIGLEVSSYIHVDDTGARHQGKNGYCTHVGNELFAWFESIGSKSRINFLELLRSGFLDYVLGEHAFSYLKKQKLPQKPLGFLHSTERRAFLDKKVWEKHLDDLEIKEARHRQIATEGALVGSTYCLTGFELISKLSVMTQGNLTPFNMLYAGFMQKGRSMHSSR